MHSFQDNAVRTWTVAINVALVKRVRGLLDLNSSSSWTTGPSR